MDFSISGLLAGFVYGVFGMAFLKRSRKESNIVLFVLAMALMIYPYFITNMYLLWGLGACMVFIGYKIH